ncbi:hypothetical protein MKEN_00168000 [Mycena kentingensis (nom. inval.)]|nr:hypothetical protein MKEN_00168000 [Mycena kentingensis (nom. inval.)]
MSSTHPIAVAHDRADFHMGSYTEDGSFNPASYNRHFLGSPMSWRAGSFGAQFVPSQSPTAMLVGSFDPAKSPQDSSIMNAWNVFDRQTELCQNYSCCGVNLPDLHALLEHFEDIHIIVKDRAQPPTIQIPFNPTMNVPDSGASVPAPTPSQSVYANGPFDTDEMDLGLDYDNDAAASPPPSTAPTSRGTSRAPSPTPSPTSAQRPSLNIALTGVGFPGVHTPLSASGSSFNGFSNRFGNDYAGQPEPEEGASGNAAVAPGLVYPPEPELPVEEPIETDSNQGTPISPVAQSTSSAVPVKHSKSKRSSSSPSGASSRVSAPSASSYAAVAAANAAALSNASILLPHKPFRCPKPNCSKSYKQANGLKYHLTHGSCSFAPAKDVEAVRAMLERKRVAQASANISEEEPVSAPSQASPTQLSQAEINEVEARMRPYACGIGDCTRRYKNMNGLRYHYQHSGDHGAVGLSLLAGGLHGCLALKGNSTTSVNSAPTTPTGTTAPAAGTTSANGTSSYAWGSTLLPHIQAVATDASASSPSSSRPATPSSATAPSVSKKQKKKSEATAFVAGSTASTSTFPVTPAPATNGHVQPQFQNFQQQWYAGSNPSTPNVAGQQMQVDVSMG